jgi:hypothetical protein
VRNAGLVWPTDSQMPRNAEKARRVPHVRRPIHDGRDPVRITMRVQKGLPSLRQQRVQRLIVSVIAEQRGRKYKDEFRVIHFTIQRTGVELVIEAESQRALDKGYAAIRAGVSGFMIAVAKRLNMLLKRRGKVWADRYERFDLTSSWAASASHRLLLRMLYGQVFLRRPRLRRHRLQLLAARSERRAVRRLAA